MNDSRRSRGLLLFLLAGCISLTPFGCTRVVEKSRVTGTVTVNGEPVETGIIAFEPEDPSQPSATAEIRDGQFAIESPRGTRRISIMAYREAKGLGPDGEPYQEQYLPAKFNLETEQTLEVDAAPMTGVEFDLTLTDQELKQP